MRFELLWFLGNQFSSKKLNDFLFSIGWGQEQYTKY
jgi:hypothetical protein